MKRKYSGIIVIGLMALLIGWVLSVLITTTDGSDQGGLVPWAKVRAYEDELKVVRAEKDDALAELAELESKIHQIEQAKSDEDVLVKGLVTELEKYKMASGVLDTRGPGVLITVKDPPVVDEYQADYSFIWNNTVLLLEVVNRLKEAGAEAVSINEQRIVGTTEISFAGNAVNINGTATVPPFSIKAIGDPDIMESALSIRGGILETMKMKYNLSVDIVQREELIIPRYNGLVNFKYAKPVASGADQEG